MFKSSGWRRDPARHSLAAKGIRTGHVSQRSGMRALPIDESPQFERASADAYKTGRKIGLQGINDDDAGPKAFNHINGSVVKVTGRKQDVNQADEEWEVVNSYLWDDFWRGWREGFQDYQEREWY